MKDQKNKRENFMKDFLRCDKKSEGDNGKISVFSASAGLYRQLKGGPGGGVVCARFPVQRVEG